jgi:hypothetical protein
MMEMIRHTELTSTETLKFTDAGRAGRTPSRKLNKDDIASASALIRGCTTQSCCGDDKQLPDVITM